METDGRVGADGGGSCSAAAADGDPHATRMLKLLKGKLADATPDVLATVVLLEQEFGGQCFVAGDCVKVISAGVGNGERWVELEVDVGMLNSFGMMAAGHRCSTGAVTGETDCPNVHLFAAMLLS